MSYITYSEITPRSFIKSESLNIQLSAKPASQGKIFLSYSHEDKSYVYEVVKQINANGGNVYVDFLDDTLVGKSNEQAAAILRDHIKTSRKFISLFTKNSDKSRWMAWELGLGDGLINYLNVAMLPIVIDPSLGVETEFKNIYARIEKNESFPDYKSWILKYPDGRKMPFLEWINK